MQWRVHRIVGFPVFRSTSRSSPWSTAWESIALKVRFHPSRSFNTFSHTTFSNTSVLSVPYAPFRRLSLPLPHDSTSVSTVRLEPFSAAAALFNICLYVYRTPPRAHPCRTIPPLSLPHDSFDPIPAVPYRTARLDRSYPYRTARTTLYSTAHFPFDVDGVVSTRLTSRIHRRVRYMMGSVIKRKIEDEGDTGEGNKAKKICSQVGVPLSRGFFGGQPGAYFALVCLLPSPGVTNSLGQLSI